METDTAERMLAAGPVASQRLRYNWRAEIFIARLPGIMHITYRKAVIDMQSGIFLYHAASTPDPVHEMMRAAVQHVVEGLEAHLHHKGAVRTCLKEFSSILRTLRGLNAPLRILAGPTTWTLLEVLLAYPRDYKLATRVLRHVNLIVDMRSPNEDGQVVLSDAVCPRAIAIMNDFLDRFDTRRRYINLWNATQSVQQWINDGATLGKRYA